jgi:hypothetical protein
LTQALVLAESRHTVRAASRCRVNSHFVNE